MLDFGFAIEKGLFQLHFEFLAVDRRGQNLVRTASMDAQPVLPGSYTGDGKQHQVATGLAQHSQSFRTIWGIRLRRIDVDYYGIQRGFLMQWENFVGRVQIGNMKKRGQ